MDVTLPERGGPLDIPVGPRVYKTASDASMLANGKDGSCSGDVLVRHLLMLVHTIGKPRELEGYIVCVTFLAFPLFEEGDGGGRCLQGTGVPAGRT